jgi:hypothetical protein
MSKDGDWILRETPEACRKALAVLERHGARYRPSAPLDVRWLAGGWSSHFEFTDPDRRRAPDHGNRSRRSPVKAALAKGSREAVVVELARESDHLQQQDRTRLEAYMRAAEPYVREFQAANVGDLPLPEAHHRACELAERLLPRSPLKEAGSGAPQ